MSLDLMLLTKSYISLYIVYLSPWAYTILMFAMLIYLIVGFNFKHRMNKQTQYNENTLSILESKLSRCFNITKWE